MAHAIAVVRDGHTTWLKWHRARTAAGDLPFTGERIVEGMRLGASVEVDLRRHAEGGFAVLHDATLDRSTTGAGPVATHTRADLRALHLRDATGQPTSHRVMLLEDLAALLADAGIADGALLQLDLKENIDALGPAEIAGFAAAVGPLARHMIVSGGDAAAIDLLVGVAPSMQSGFDPSDEERFLAMATAGDLHRFLDGFVEAAVAAAPRADMIYLYWEIVTRAHDAGVDLVDAFHRHGKRIDAWTLNTVDTETIAIAERLLTLKVDQITTDDPAGLYAALNPATSQG
jgi:glycerophosphoryl diester phosphodiesterase